MILTEAFLTNVWMPTKETKHKGLCFLLLKNSHYSFFPLAIPVANPTVFAFSGDARLPNAVPLYKKIFVFIYFYGVIATCVPSSSLKFHFLFFFLKKERNKIPQVVFLVL